MFGQGPSWQKCRPAGFMSKKFTNAQQNYAVHELEMLVILEALMKWEDELVGYKIHVITNHKALEFFKTQANLTSRQRQWTDYMSRFNFDITYIKEELNKVADCLSQYYKNDTPNNVYDVHEYVGADRRIDPTGEDLPVLRLSEIQERVVEIAAMRAMETRRARHLREQQDDCEVQAQVLDQARPLSESIHQLSVSGESAPHSSEEAKEEGEDPTIAEALLRLGVWPVPAQRDDKIFAKCICSGYTEDAMFSKVIE